MIEIRWHGRGGQGAKTASQLLALAEMADGLWVQAFPEYGPERSGAPMVAYNRADTRRVRRHDAVERPDLVVVLDESLWAEAHPLEGLPVGGRVLVNAEPLSSLRDAFRDRVMAVPGNRLAEEAHIRFANVVMVGAALAVLGHRDADPLEEAVRTLFARRLQDEAVQGTVRAARAGFAWGIRGEAAS